MLVSKKCFYFLILSLSLVLTGCASNATVGGMTYKDQMTGKPKNASLVDNVGISSVTGGHETNPLWASQINNKNFEQALEASLKNADLYNKVNGKYQLKATLIKLKQPLLGLDLQVVCQAHYTIQNVAVNKVIYDKDITTTYTATFKDSPIAITRLKLANEGAARENIKQLIADLYQL